MRLWLNLLFYIICFLGLMWTIYRLALIVPPVPGDEEYLLFCLHAAAFAAIISGLAVGMAAAFDRYWRKNKKK